MQNSRVKLLLSLSFSFMVILCACNNGDMENDPLAPDAVYFEYRIWGGDDMEDMMVKIQYRLGGPGGETYMFQEPGKVQFDSLILPPDSSKMNGYHYETWVPVADLTGRHSIGYTEPGGRSHIQEFDFQPFTLATELPPQVRRGDIEFRFDGLKDSTLMRILVTDTASFSEGIVRTDTIFGGLLRINRAELLSLRNGPINLQLVAETEKLVREGGRRRGKLFISYALNREFELVD